MKFQAVIVWTVIAVAALLLIINMEAGTFKDILKTFIPKVEGFSSKPYWDNLQLSWGYGTKVPGSVANKNVVPNKTITREQAFSEMMNDLNYRYSHLQPQVKRNLRPSQWAAFLSFAYNVGLGAADKLIPQINSADLAALETHWKQYNRAGGIVSTDLVNRRSKEWQLYIS